MPPGEALSLNLSLCRGGVVAGLEQTVATVAEQRGMQFHIVALGQRQGAVDIVETLLEVRVSIVEALGGKPHDEVDRVARRRVADAKRCADELLLRGAEGDDVAPQSQTLLPAGLFVGRHQGVEAVDAVGRRRRQTGGKQQAKCP